MAIGNPVSYWYGTKAQYNALSLHIADTLYFITDEQTIYKGDVRFAEGVEQLSAVDSSAPASPAKYDKYFDTDDGKIYVYDGTSWGNAYYPAEGNMYYDKNAKRFVYFVPTYDGTTVTGGSMSDVYDAGVSGDSNQGVSIQGTSTVTVANASVNGKGVVKIGDNINVTNAGVISVNTATTSAKGVVQTGDNITNTNGVISVAKGASGVFGVVSIGANIDVANGVISVKTASTSDPGVVQLVNDANSSDMGSEVKAITPHAVSQVADGLNQEISTKQDNLSNGNVTTLNTTDGAKIDVNIGDGLAVGIEGSTNANKLITKEATVEEVLTGTTGTNIVDADNLRGALSIGQAVDVSCAMTTAPSHASYDADGFLGEFTVTWTNSGTNNHFFGFNKSFPKAAPGLKYLILMDVKNTGDVDISELGLSRTGSSQSIVQPEGLVTSLPTEAKSKTYGEFTRLASVFTDDGNIQVYYASVSSGNLQVTIKNWRQYEVTTLTDEAIAYIAQLLNPDAFFRSTDARSIVNKYLVKQDMVCPFIPTIEMENKDLTVAAGLSYKMQYKSNTAVTRTITADTIPTNGYGWDTHLQLFVDDKTTVVFQNPLVLMSPLIANAGHNMTIKWRNGQALAYVDDTDVGYIVTITSGTASGSLPYGIINNVGEYIIFSSTTDNITIDVDALNFAGTSERTMVTIIGNGNDRTRITGSISVDTNRVLNLYDLLIDGGTIGADGNLGTINLSGVVIDGTVTLLKGTHKFNGVTINGELVDNNTFTLYAANTLNGAISGTGKVQFADGAILTGNGTIYLDGLSTVGSYGNKLDVTIDGINFTCSTTQTYVTGNKLINITSSDATKPQYVKINNCHFHDLSDSGSIKNTVNYLSVGGSQGTIEVTGCTFSNCRGRQMVLSGNKGVFKFKNCAFDGCTGYIGFLQQQHDTYLYIEDCVETNSGNYLWVQRLPPCNTYFINYTSTYEKPILCNSFEVGLGYVYIKDSTIHSLDGSSTVSGIGYAFLEVEGTLTAKGAYADLFAMHIVPGSTINLTGSTVAAPFKAINSGIAVGTTEIARFDLTGTSPNCILTIDGQSFSYHVDNTNGNTVVINGSTVPAFNAVINGWTLYYTGGAAFVKAFKFIEGGTASVILADGSIHHISGSGTYINSTITGGTFSNLTEID